MNRNGYFLCILIFVIIVVMVNTLKCYTCMEKLKGNCYYGYKEELKTLNCSKNKVCVTHQSETTQGIHSYISTTRGCEDEDICDIINTAQSKTSKSISVLCQTCNTTLCNRSTTISSHIIFILVTCSFLTVL